MKNEDKRFEEDFKKSVPADVWYCRLREGTASRGDRKGTRFRQRNTCCCQLFYHGLFLIELKSHPGKSLPHEVFDAQHIAALAKALNFGIVTGAVINMRETGDTFFLFADTLLDQIVAGGGKSIPLEFMRMYGYRLKAERKRTRWRYDIGGLIESIRLGG